MRDRLLYIVLLSTAIGVVAAGSLRAQQIEQFGVGSGCGPWGIAGGPDGNLWVTCGSSGQIKKLSPGGAVLATITLPESNCYPVGIATGPDGNLWFGEHVGNRVTRLTAAGIFTEFDLPNSGSGVVGVAPGSDGNVWFTEQQGHRVGKITPQGNITEYTDPGNPGMAPGFLALGPDGNLWVNEGTNNVIAKVTPTGVFTDYTAPSATSIGGITNGADGFLWFVEDGADKVARIRASDGHIDEFGPFPGESGFGQISLGADGRIWVDENAHSKLLRLHSSGVLQAVFTTQSHAWNGIAGPDGNVWWINGAADAVTRADIATGFEDFPFSCVIPEDGGDAVLALPDGSFWGSGSSNGAGPFVEYHPMPALVAEHRYYHPTIHPDDSGFGMANDANGTLWFPDAGANAIVSQPIAGSPQGFAIPTPASYPLAVAFGSDGNLWFTEFGASQVGRLTPQGEMTEFPLPIRGWPAGLTEGPDGNIWFADSLNGAIGRATTGGDIVEFATPLRFNPYWIAADATDLYFTDESHHLSWMTTGGSGSFIATPGASLSVSAGVGGAIWFAASPLSLCEYRPATGGLRLRATQYPLARTISTSAVSGVWYGTGTDSQSCDSTHPGIFGHLRWEIFVDGFESGNEWRWSTRSF